VGGWQIANPTRGDFSKEREHFGKTQKVGGAWKTGIKEGALRKRKATSLYVRKETAW